MTTRIKPQFSPNAIKILESRYLLKDPNGNLLETPEGMLERVSFGNEEYYNLMARLDFLPNSPTLFNAGTGMGTLSACFKFDVPDSIDGIYEVAHKAAKVLKFGGGVGYCLSDLRPRGASVRSTHKVSSGPVGFMPLYQAVADTITQGGKRHGAQMAILHCDHPDIEEFINCKATPEAASALNTFNISVAATNEFMEQYSQAPLDDSNLLWKMAQNAWATGDPGCYFIDSSEARNPTPWLGKLTGTNPCGEVPLLNNEPCNLGSINLGHMLVDGEVDWDKLAYTTRLATRFLDDILDHNQFPDQAITDAALLTRKLGLGVMGWADMLVMMGIPYDSQDAVQLGETVMQFINDQARDMSTQLADQKGAAPCYYNRGVELRNSTRTCIAPTGTISILADASSGIEPHFALSWQRKTFEGHVLHEAIPVLEHAPIGFKVKTSMEIPWPWHIEHQAAFQKYTDLAVSKTINMPHEVTVDDIYNAYQYAWRSGCSGVTIFRDGSRGEQVLTSDKPQATIVDASPIVEAMQLGGFQESITLEEHTHKDGSVHVVGRRKLPRTRNSITHKFTLNSQDFYFNVGLYDETNLPGELFIKAAKEGSTLSGLLDAVGIAVSIGLQYGVPLEVYVRKYTGTKYEPYGLTDNPDIRNATSVLDYVFRWIGKRYLNGSYNELLSAEATGNLCPECNAVLAMEEGCLKCYSCGYSQC